MIKEYKLTIEAFGQNEHEAIEQAIRILNEGASFDEVTLLEDAPEQSQSSANCGAGPLV